MKLATLKGETRDGRLVIVNNALDTYVPAGDIAPSLQYALENWDDVAPALTRLSELLENGEASGTGAFKEAECESPLPRAYQWVDGSAYVNHVELVRKARGAEMPESFWTDPLMYQGGSDSFLGPQDPIPVESEDFGIDFEGEVAVVVDDVPMGVTPEDAASHIKLIMLVNDVSLRLLIPGELSKGFGFLQGKPSSAFSPVAVTPDTLGDAWDGGKVHLPLVATLNGEQVGAPNAGVDMTFDFPTLIAHAARTRPLHAGTIVGSGTVSNIDRSSGSCCLAEVRMLEKINDGEAKTSFMKFGDVIRLEMKDKDGKDIFGVIEQKIVPYAYRARSSSKAANG